MSCSSGKRSIIAMKGHPFTRKTLFATEIAGSLRCPVLSLNDFLDFLSPYCFQPSLSTNPCTPPSPQPKDLAFGIICQIAKRNLSKGLVREIVIDSPLSSRSQLDNLIELAESLPKTQLIIVECKAYNKQMWQTEFEDYSDFRSSGTQKWYEPKNWEDVEKASQEGYDERLGGYKVPKLVLDPFSDYLNYEPDSPLLIDAVRYMITRDQGDGPDLVEYHLWRQGQYLVPKSTSDNMEEDDQLGFCRAGSGHYITEYTKEGLKHEATCRVCENQLFIGEAAYTCKHCRFALLHKECAELLDNNNKSLRCPTPYGLNSLLNGGYRLNYHQDSCRCGSCEQKHSFDPNSSCGDCLFTTHLKKKVLPTVIRHGCDEHFLSIMMKDLNHKENSCQCKACGSPVDNIWYSCKICGVDYDYKCLTMLPLRVRNEHGGHNHYMELKYSNVEAEDYLCDWCFGTGCPEKRDPRRWFYSCQECQYVAHLKCVSDDWYIIPIP